MSDDREPRRGRFLGIPYDFAPLTWRRFKAGIWNPDEERILIPKVWGWGYGVNLQQVARRLRLVRR
jgi:hypothetical protein